MTGTFNLQLIEDARDARKWILRKANVGKTILSGLVQFEDVIVNSIINEKATKQFINNWIHTLQLKQITNDESRWVCTTKKLKTDVYRKFTITEYYTLSRLFKSFKVKYNKKLDEFQNI